MSAIDLAALVIAVLLLGYPVVALFHPERF